MTEIEELQCEIDVLRGRIAAAEEAARIICDGLASYLEVVGVISRAQLGEMLIAGIRNRRNRGEGSSVENDVIETAAKHLFFPSTATIAPVGAVN